MKHTPGPWRVVEHSWSDTGIYSDKNHIAHLSIEGVATESNQSQLEASMGANAKLIAAAPELLEACQTLAEWFKRENEGFPNAGEVRKTAEGEAAWRRWWEENLRLCDLAKTQADAAIAKATE